jgi:hypothetical protein
MMSSGLPIRTDQQESGGLHYGKAKEEAEEAVSFTERD